MKFLVSFQYGYSHCEPHVENRQIERTNLPTYTDLQKLEQEIAEEKKKANAGTPSVVILCCHPIAG